MHYVLVVGGEVAYESWADDPKDVLGEAESAIYQQISDHHRHKLPFKVTEEDKRWFDVRVYSLPREEQGLPQRFELPFQKWVDNYYQEMLQADKDDVRREYERYLELKEQWEGKPAPPEYLEHLEKKKKSA